MVLRAGVACDERELLSFCEGRLGLFKTPTRIYFAADLPKGPSGKVQRLRLREEATQPAIARLGSSGSGFAVPQDNGSVAHNRLAAATASIERVIAETWAEVLSPTAASSLTSNFFALGGHSLLAVQCVSRLRERIPVALSLSDFFENATVDAAKPRLSSSDCSRTIRRRVKPTPIGRLSLLKKPCKTSRRPLLQSTIPPRDRTVPCPLSPAQRRLWFMQQLNPGLPVYNEAEAVRLRGELNVDAMERALNIIVARHEILRTTIRTMGDEPVAVVHESWPLQIKKIDLSAAARSGTSGGSRSFVDSGAGATLPPGNRTWNPRYIAPPGPSGACPHPDDAPHHL